MVKVEMMDGSRKAVHIDGGGTGRHIIMRVMVPDGDREKQAVLVSLSCDEAEAIENALRIQRRAAERRK